MKWANSLHGEITCAEVVFYKKNPGIFIYFTSNENGVFPQYRLFDEMVYFVNFWK